jgi:hypothetical protein
LQYIKYIIVGFTSPSFSLTPPPSFTIDFYILILYPAACWIY